MSRFECINPDDFLQTSQGRVWTAERNRRAWDEAFAALRAALGSLARETGNARPLLYVVCGIQGSGKSTWVRENGERLAPCVFFDAALPGVRHRAPLISIAREIGAVAHAVWVNTPLTLALERNAGRSRDERVPEVSILSVHGQFEVPSIAEGFHEILEITPSMHSSM